MCAILDACVEGVLGQYCSVVAILATPVYVVVMATITILVDLLSAQVAKFSNRPIALHVNVVIRSEGGLSIGLVSNQNVVLGLGNWTVLVTDAREDLLDGFFSVRLVV